MLTSIRGTLAASVSFGVLLSATPALANEAEAIALVDAGETIVINDADVVEAQIIEISDAAESAPTLIDPSIDWSAQSAAAERASAPVADEAANALADDSPLSFSANVALATEYRFRGVNLSGGNFAIQGGLDLSHSSGFYIGTWGSNLDEQTVGYGSSELDLYGGWSGNLTDAVSVDVGAIAYIYPDAGPGEFDYYEVYGSVGFSLGPVSVTPGFAYAFDQDSLGGTDNTYLYTDLSIGIPDTPVTLNGHLGYTDGFLTFTNDSKAVDWSIGADLAVGPVTFNVSYIDVESDALVDPGEVFTSDAFVATVSASF
ncbi:MAG: TorF family putative porin [Pseudomonadota bacterium]